MRSWVLALVAIAVLGCPAPRATVGVDRTPPPRDTSLGLVVLLVIDQWPQWAFEQKRPALAGGFDRMLREGAWHIGRLPSAATITAPSHALLGTGEPTATSGILANEWWSRDAARMIGSVEDLDGTRSTRWLRVAGLGDAVAAAKTGAKAVAVSLKDRSAMLTLGHAGTAIWYDKAMLAFTSTVPLAWLAEHSRRHPIQPRLAEPWTPLDAARLAQLSGTTDDQAGEVGTKGLGPTFPHVATATKDPGNALHALPLANELVIETALAAIDGEQLGADRVPDLLVISLSAHDYVGHGWGHESWEAWDLALRLDQQLERLLAALDTKVGAGRWAMLATSDHGAAPLPERAGGGRIAHETLQDAANRAAIAELGAGDWVASAKYPTVFLTAAGLAAPPKQKTKALTKIVYALRSFPGIDRVEKTAELAGNCGARAGDAIALCLAIDAERSGEVIYTPARGWIIQSRDEPAATAHGSLHAYDREVPVVILEPGRVAHTALAGPSDATIEMTQIASVIARWLAVPAPSSLPRGGR